MNRFPIYNICKVATALGCGLFGTLMALKNLVSAAGHYQNIAILSE
jgi:hypothetical protein|tara:strand:- start:208 stop:345 length:138 start_codon:yes stop_codon:yes gene_type:complete